MKRLTLLSFALALLASCQVSSGPGQRYPSTPPPPSHDGDGGGPPPPPPSDGGGGGIQAHGRIRVQWRVDRGWQPERQWEEISKINVKRDVDEQTTEGIIGRKTWRAIAISSKGQPVDVQDVELVLGEGGSGGAYVPELRHTFAPGQSTAVIELPPGAELVHHLTVHYGSHGTGEAQLFIYGLPNR